MNDMLMISLKNTQHVQYKNTDFTTFHELKYVVNHKKLKVNSVFDVRLVTRVSTNIFNTCG